MRLGLAGGAEESAAAADAAFHAWNAQMWRMAALPAEGKGAAGLAAEGVRLAVAARDGATAADTWPWRPVWSATRRGWGRRW